MHNMHYIDDTSNMVIITVHRACSTLSCIEHKCIIDHRGRSTVYSAITTTIMGHLSWSSSSIIIGHIVSIPHQSSMILLHDRSSLEDRRARITMADNYRTHDDRWLSSMMIILDGPKRWSRSMIIQQDDHRGRSSTSLYKVCVRWACSVSDEHVHRWTSSSMFYVRSSVTMCNDL